jgi:hypothetical protein
MRSLAVIVALCVVGLAVVCPRAGSHPSDFPAAGAASAPATRPVVERLVGTYRGTVVDDDEVVPCVTTFWVYEGEIAGKYTVRAGRPDAYNGTLDRYKLVSNDRGECRLRWTDKNGEGILTIQVSEDGDHFAGSWGLEVAQDKLVWRGKREKRGR